MGKWSVVFLKTTRTATCVVSWEKGYRELRSLPDDTPKRGIYAGEFDLDIDSVPPEVEDKMQSALASMCAKAAKALGLNVGGSFAFFADEKARLLEVKPL